MSAMLRKATGDNDTLARDNKITVVDESEVEVSNVSEDRVMFSCQVDGVNLDTYAEYADDNSNIACNSRLNEIDNLKLVKHMTNMPKAGDDFDLIRARVKNGNWEMLIGKPDTKSLRIWIPLHIHPNSLDSVCQILETSGATRVTGSPKRFFRSLGIYACYTGCPYKKYTHLFSHIIAKLLNISEKEKCLWKG